MLCYVVLCCVVLCCAVLCCAVLCCVVLCCVVLCCVVLCCAVFCCVVLCCAVLCCAVLCSAVLCCVVLCDCMNGVMKASFYAVMGCPEGCRISLWWNCHVLGYGKRKIPCVNKFGGHETGHALRTALCKRSEAHLHSNINWLALFVISRCFYASLCEFSRCLCPASSLAVGVSPRLSERYAFHFAKLHNRKRCSSGECIVGADGEPLRWSPKFRDTIVHCCFPLLVCPSVRSASFPDDAVMPVRCAGCRLSYKAKWPMDTVLPFLCCQRKPSLIVHKPQLCMR